MRIRLRAFALSVFLLLSPITSSYAATLGPAQTYDDLRELLASADRGDIILVSGAISADDNVPLHTTSSVRLSSSDGTPSSISGLRLQDASVSFADITLCDSLIVGGTSHIQLASDVSVSGAYGLSGLSFTGNGTLIIDPGCSVTGGSEGDGISISHSGGEFYASIEGNVQGGSGASGGSGVTIAPLSSHSAVMIAGSIQGGSGSSLGGHALNLYNLSGNAYVTVDANLRGGDGVIGGNGIQLVAARDRVNVGIDGKIKGGRGESYGGDALILMNAEGASSFQLSGTFSGGDASGRSAQPGTSLQLVGDSTAAHTHVVDCILEDGMRVASSTFPSSVGTPTVTPLPEIETSIRSIEFLTTPPYESQETPSQDATPSEPS